MASIPRLQKRPENGIYYCRVRVPKDLVSIIGKREIKVSLQTTNLRVAMKALAAASYKAECQLTAARGEQPDVLIPSLNQGITLKQLTEHYFAAQEQAKLTASTIMEYKIRFRVMMELMGAEASGASAARRAGSSPVLHQESSAEGLQKSKQI